MRVDVIMPQMGESIAEGTLTKWLKKPGDKVSRDEPIFEISTDKVDAEIPSPAAGVLAEVKVGEGETVPINTVVAQIETEATAGAGAARPAAPGGDGRGEGRTAGAPGPRPGEGALPAEARGSEAAAAAPRQPAPAARGESAGPARPAGETGPRRDAGGAGPGRAESAAASAAAPRASGMAGSGADVEEMRRTRSSPVVRRMAREHGIDISRIEGSGISGRVTKKDMMAALETGGAAAAARPAPAPAAFPSAPPRPAAAPGDRVTVEPMSPMRRKIAEHMVLSRHTSAHVTTVFQVDMHKVMKLREEYGEAFKERHGVKLQPTSFFVKSAVEALKQFPILNASIDADTIVYKKDINIGVAVALDWGLIVPVIRHADELSLAGIAKAVQDLAERARAKRLQPDEVQGGTFTITNPGVYGALFGTPIINQPQVAIMGVGTIMKQVIVIEDAIAIHPIVHLSLSFDHRLIDGAVADQFMAYVKTILQEGRFPEIV